jgi:hypothetical protein
MRPSLLPFVVAFACAGPACRSEGASHSASGSASAAEKASPSPAESAPSPTAESPPPTGSSTAKLVRCGWGPVSATAAADDPPWAIALVDVELPGPARGLHVTAMELSTDRGIAAKMGARATLRVQEGALGFSYAAADTREVGDALPAGTYRLRAAAALDRKKKAIESQKPTVCSVALTDDADRTLVARGNVDPVWQNE